MDMMVCQCFNIIFDTSDGWILYVLPKLTFLTSHDAEKIGYFELLWTQVLIGIGKYSREEIIQGREMIWGITYMDQCNVLSINFLLIYLSYKKVHLKSIQQTILPIQYLFSPVKIVVVLNFQPPCTNFVAKL